MVRNDAINIYTDGSSFSKPRRVGGMGVRLVFVDSDANEHTEDVVLEGHVGATNNQMELRAAAEGLRLACEHPESRKYQRIFVFSDSQYVVGNWRNALNIWPQSDWRTRDGAPVLNVELWKHLVSWIFKIGRRVEFHWVKGHAKDAHNKTADRLAKASAKNVVGPLSNPPLSIVTVRRKMSARSVQRGSVQMLGQRLRIGIVTSEYLAEQRTTKFKYEVLSTGSRYHGQVDIAFSSLPLKAGHHYEVVLNRKQGAPGFVSLLRELDR